MRRWILLVVVPAICVVADVQALESQPVPGAQPAGKTRVLHFPKERCLGIVYAESNPEPAVPRAGTLDLPLLTSLAEGRSPSPALAQGDLVVPAGQKLVLMAAEHSSPMDLQGLQALDPNDLHAVCVDSWVGGGEVDDRILAPLSHLTGLRVLTLGRHIGTIGKGLRHLNQLRYLEALELGARASDADLATLDLPELKYLSCEGWISDAGIRHLNRFPRLRWLRLRTGTFAGPGLADLGQAPCLDSLCLWGDPGPTDQHISYIQGLTHLKRLTIWGAQLTDASLRSIGRLTDLEDLTFIKVTGFTEDGVAYLGNLKNLKRLDVGGLWSTVGDKGIGYLTSLPQLEVIPEVQATSEGIPALASFPHLKTLSLRWMGPAADPGLHPQGSVGSRLGIEGDVLSACIRQLAKFKSLEELRLYWCTDYGREDDIHFLEALTNLRRLTLSTTKPVTADFIDAVSKLKNLEFLLLTCSGITRADLNRLNSLTKLAHLEVLGSREFTAEGSALDLSGLKDLRMLSIRVVGLRDADLACLADLPHLRSLSVDGTFSEQGLRYLKDLTELGDLQIGGISMPTGESVSYLAGLRNLGYLTLRGRVTDAAVNRLAELPPSVWSLRITTDEAIQSRSITRVEQSLPILTYEHPHGVTIEKMFHKPSQDEFLSEYYRNTRNQPFRISPRRTR
jgi:hypothetical protein